MQSLLEERVQIRVKQIREEIERRAIQQYFEEEEQDTLSSSSSFSTPPSPVSQRVSGPMNQYASNVSTAFALVKKNSILPCVYPGCGRMLTQAAMNMHMRRKHGDLSNQSIKTKCKKCHNVFPSKTEAYYHSRNCDGVVEGNRKRTGHKCKKCERRFPSRKEMSTHMKYCDMLEEEDEEQSTTEEGESEGETVLQREENKEGEVVCELNEEDQARERGCRVFADIISSIVSENKNGQ
ncbi:MAG: hypothetical protein JWL77_7115 [Chthonomonadaceae bacterium]|nr:hypothetical protein [Chthonomonadaceae bacterium]